MLRTLKVKAVIWMLFFVGMAVFNAAAQQTTATLTGTVTDGSGSIVQNATVTATNLGTNLTLSATTNAEGQYRIDLLPVGNYSLQVVASGFKNFVQNGIELSLGEFATINAVVEVGGSTETVTVTADAPLLNLSNQTVGASVENKEIENLPIVNRNVYDLLSLVPGVSLNSTTNTLGYPQQVVLINGGVQISNSGSTSYYLDGATNMTGLRNTGNVQPNPDAVDQFRVDTNNYSAEYGRFPNGVINVITKSGTNNFHGSLFEFWRETALNAKDYLSISPTALHRNQYGGTLGGPIFKDKTFFFFSYGGLRQITSTFFNSGIVPTAAQRTGDFSANLPTSSGTITGSTLCSTTLSAADTAAGNFLVCNPTSSTTASKRTVYAGNKIPAAALDPTVQNLLKTSDTSLPRIGLPNAANNVLSQTHSYPTNSDEFLLKVDHNFTSTHRVTGEVFENGTATQQSAGGTTNTGTIGGAQIYWSTQNFTARQWTALASDLYTINANWVNQFWVSFSRELGGRVNTPTNTIADYGAAFKVQGAPSLPQIAVSGYFTAANAIAGQIAGSNYYEVRDLINWSHGLHSMRFGGDVGLDKDVLLSNLNNYGVFSFSKSTSARTGNALSDFIMGLPNTMNQDAGNSLNHTNSWYTGLFFQDDYRILPRFTLNLGVRYDIQTPPVETDNKEENFFLGQQSTVIPTAPVGLVVVGDKGVPRGVVPVRWNHASPRVGFAWDVLGDGKTSLRAGAGLFWGSISGNEWASTGEPFSLRQQFNTIQSVTNPYGTVAGGSPFPYTYTPASPKFTKPFAVQSTSTNFDWTSTYQLNTTLEHQWRPSFVTSVGYVGGLGRHLPVAFDTNSAIYATASNPVNGITTSTSSNVDSRRPIGGGTTFQGINQFSSEQTSAYHSMIVQANERLGKQLNLKSYYIWSKSWSSTAVDSSTGTPEDPRNLVLERGRTDNDYRHNFVTSFVWLLDYYHHDNRIVKTALNGWQISPIVSIRSGKPFTVTVGSDINLDGQNTDRPNVIGQPALDPHRSRAAVMAEWFNPSPSVFATPAAGTDGLASRNFLNGPGSKKVDMGIFRNFNFLENYTLQFRGEFTNIFNTVNLSNPTTSLSSPIVGQITGAAPMRQTQLGLRLTF